MQKIDIKTEKVKEYWKKESMLIPNVFRLFSLMENENNYLLEFQDLSSKIVLVQGNGSKMNLEDEETNTTEAKKPIRNRTSTKAKSILKIEKNVKKF